ncbi:ankyrin-1-like [Phymastichus coffea]|uniref:ankyrin-1-like n=1 Tax=Phymastichus coffea TaxID=108790 RepID=UPI00273C17E4|nr:ankyrin-1-like [Phymastichus coffea]
MAFYERHGKKYFADQLIESLRCGEKQTVVHLIQDVAADELVDCHRVTLLHLAAKYNNAEIVKYLINHGSVIDAVDDGETTPLITAVKEESVKAVKTLLEEGASFYPSQFYEKCALNVAVKLSKTPRSLKIFKQFFYKISLDLANGHFSINELANKLRQAECPLYRAVFLYDPEVTKALIDFEPDCLNSQDPDTGNTALHEAANQSDIANMLVLLQNGANINIKNYKGKEPRVLKFCYNMEILRLLLKRNIAWEESENDCKAMKLSYILCKCSKAGVELFLQYYNINFLTRDNYERTPLYYLIENKNTDVLELFQYNDFDVNALDRSNHSALHNAALRGNSICTCFLLEKGADPNIRSDRNYTPLFCVVQQTNGDYSSRKKCIEFLLLFGADPEHQKDGETVIGVAQQLGVSDLIEPVLAHLALMESENKSISEINRTIIASCETTKDYYDCCLISLLRLKQERLYRSLTTYTFLISDDCTLARYVDIPSVSDRFSKEEIHYNSYYNEILKRRFKKAVEIQSLRKFAIHHLSDIFEIWSSDSPILQSIVNCLKYEELVLLQED